MSHVTIQTDAVLAEVAAERLAQDQKWGQQNHPNGTGDDWSFCSGQHAGWAQEAADDARRRCQEAPGRVWGDTYALILNEEVAEAFAEDDPAALRRELIQVAAVAVAWVEKIDREADACVTCSGRGVWMDEPCSDCQPTPTDIEPGGGCLHGPSARLGLCPNCGTIVDQAELDRVARVRKGAWS